MLSLSCAKLMAGFWRVLLSHKSLLKSKFNPSLPVLRLFVDSDSDMSAVMQSNKSLKLQIWRDMEGKGFTAFHKLRDQSVFQIKA